MDQKRIQIVLGLILMASLGLLAGQAYWLSNRYDVEKEKLIEEADLALNDALMESYLDDFPEPDSAEEGLTFWELPGIDGFKQQIDSILSPELKEEIKAQGETEMSDIYVNLIQDWPLQGLPDTIQESIAAIPEREALRQMLSNQVMKMMSMVRKRETSLETFTQAFDSALAERGLSLRYQLGLWRDSVLVESLPASLKQASLGEASLTRPWNGFDLSHQSPEIKVYLLRTASAVLIRMGGSMLISLLLIVLILGSLAYLLRVIFRQKKLAEVKNDFINNMTHELKTPIASVSAAVEALLHFGGLEDPERAQRYLKLSQGELSRLEGMVEKVLSLAAFERESQRLKREKTDIKELLQALVQRFRDDSRKLVNINFRNEMVSPFAWVDKFHFTQALSNILDNAIKYSGDSVDLMIVAKDEPEHVEIRISDNGIGIEPAQQKYVFEKFYRVPTGDLHPTKGFGLGLSFVKNIINLHKGEVWLESKAGQGTHFFLKIPRKYE